MMRAGFVPVLAAIVCEDQLSQYQSQAADVLSNMGRSNDYQTAVVIAEQRDLFWKLHAILADRAGHTTAQRVSALVLVATLSRGLRALTDTLARLERQRGQSLIAVLELSFQGRNDEITEKCLWALGNFGWSPRFKQRVLSGKTLELVIRLLEEEPSLLQFTCLKFCGFAFFQISNDVCTRLFEDSNGKLVKLIVKALAGEDVPDYEPVKLFGYDTRALQYNLHKWSTISLLHICGCSVGRACVTKYFSEEPLNVIPALTALVERAMAMPGSESGSAALSLMIGLSEVNQKFSAAFGKYVSQAQQLLPQLVSNSPDFMYTVENLAVEADYDD
eukprot:TRINITY_DN37367_c0_g1_i1.p1 TRINITY_DN37367_c0_g1~~TRINITY_DN37367_c0_g1_i1.p1  ORF type:complete len:332 (+),score=63.64 TRINITY_DN37367_c0_g1_i1:168-1163(+)